LDQQTQIIITAVALLISALVPTGLILYAKFFRKRLAEAPVDAGAPFDLVYTTQKKFKRMRISLRFDISYEMPEDNYELICEFKVYANGRQVIDEIAGAGQALSRQVNRVISTFYWTSSTGIGGSYRLSSTVRLGIVDAVDAMTELRVTGVITAGNQTGVNSLTIFIN
jgi:hypothetical protein